MRPAAPLHQHGPRAGGRYSRGVARPPSFSPALVAVLATLAAAFAMVAGVAGPSSALPAVSDGESLSRALATTAWAAPRARAADPSPLKVSIDSLSPSYVPRSGPIRVTGSVTNRDDQTWLAVNIYPFASAAPMTTRAELAAATLTDPILPVGDRITTEGYYDSIGDIEPGATLQFSLAVPRSALTSQTGEPIEEPGVYWFGVHALGESTDGRDTNADGRARTFLPLVPASIKRSTDTALVIPLRRDISYDADGSLEGVEGWTRTLSAEGKLRSLVDFGVAAGSRPITWLVDPALPDAVRKLVAGNAPRSMAPTQSEEPDDTQTPAEPGETGFADPAESAVPDPTPSEGDTGDGSTGDDEVVDEATAAAAQAGSAWLDRLREALSASQILALPYGDLDVAAAAAHDPSLYESARERSTDFLEPGGLRTSAGLGSPSGYLSAAGIAAAEPGSTVLVTDRMFGADPPGVATVEGHQLVVTSSGAAAGGPGPGDPLAPVNLRQRILSEAALRLLSPGGKPLVVVLPADWTPPSASGFFEGLDVDWVDLSSLAEASARRGTPVDVEALDYPPLQSRRELDAASFDSASRLVDSGEALQNVLTLNDEVASVVADQAFNSLSYSSRLHPDAVRAEVDSSRSWIDAKLRMIEIDAPRGVTLSSSSGRFAATITNGLDQPVTVSIDYLADEPFTIDPPAPVEVGANGRATILLNAHASTLGVHSVTLVVTDSEGTPLGSSDQLTVRSAQFSKVIWLILGTGCALLFVAIVIRLFRRIRRARTPPDEPAEPAEPADAGAAPDAGAEPSR